MPQPKNTLIIGKLDEISFVDQGDNPPALVKITKAAPPIGDPMPDTEVVSKEAFEALQKRLHLMEENEAVAKVRDEVAPIVKRAGSVPDVDLATTLRAIDKASPEAGAAIRKVLNAYAARVDTSVVLNKRAGASDAGGNALEQFNSKVSEIRKANPGMLQTDAISLAATQNPSLYNAANGVS